MYLKGPLDIDGSLTASGDISASGTISGGDLSIANIVSNGDILGINVTASGNISASGYISASSAVVTDLTDNRIVIVGPGGELKDSFDLQFEDPEFRIGNSVFTVQAGSGDTLINGTLDVYGNLSMINGDGGSAVEITPEGDISASGEILAQTVTASYSLLVGTSGIVTGKGFRKHRVFHL